MKNYTIEHILQLTGILITTAINAIVSSCAENIKLDAK